MSWSIQISGHAGGDEAELSAVRQVFADAVRACRQLNVGLSYGSYSTTVGGGNDTEVSDEDRTPPDLSAVPGSPRREEEEQPAYPASDAVPGLQQGTGS